MSNRDELTRQAEKSLRQGRVDDAIAQYQELASLLPVDWCVVKHLADLLERAGQCEAAAAQFGRWADHLFAEGFHSKAAALYKKVLKLDTSHERALWQLGEVSIQLNLRADARLAFQRVLELRQRRGDADGTAQARERLRTLEGAPPLAAARAPLAGLTPVRPAADELVALPHRTASLAPPDATPPVPLAGAAPPGRVVSPPAPVPPPPPLSDADPAALPRLRQAVDAEARQAPDAEAEAALDDRSRAQHALAAAYAEEGRAADARAVAEHVSVREAGAEPYRSRLLDLPERLGEAEPEPIAGTLLPSARDILEEDARGVSDDLGARARAASPLAAAADPASPVPPPPATFDWAYLLGRETSDGDPAAPPAPAADDHTGEAHTGPAGGPDNSAPEVERQREWASLLGHALGAVPAPQLAAPSDAPFGIDEAVALAAAPDFAAIAEPQPDPPRTAGALPPSSCVSSSSLGEPPPVSAIQAASGSPGETTRVPQPLDAPGVAQGAEVAALAVDEEIDLTELLEELKHFDTVLPDARVDTVLEAVEASGVDSAPGAASAQPLRSDGEVPVAIAWLPSHRADTDLDAAFADLHRHTDPSAVAEQQLAAGRVFLAAGLMAEAARAFEHASQAPRARFEAAQALAELYRSRGQLAAAVSWYERAAAAPAADAAVKRPVLYDLAESLEALGETDRALGVLLDLLSQVEDFRDARARLDRLLRVDAGG